MKKESTEAQKWLQTLKDRTAGITGFEPGGTVAKIVGQLDADYPNQVFALVDQARVVGTRKVFGDRSYCDMLFADASIGRITCDVLSSGLLGTAQNGRIIH